MKKILKMFDVSAITGIVSLCTLIIALSLTVSAFTQKVDVPPEIGTPDFIETVPPTDVAPEPPQTGETTPPAVEPPVTVVPPPVPVKPKDTLIMSKTDGLNVRAGKGTSYKVLGSVNSGDMLAYTEEEGGWYKVLYKNGYGYVSSAYVGKYSFEKAEDGVEKVIGEGKKLLGTPYVYGAQRYHFGNGVKNSAFTVSEFDCSSLMQYIFKKGANVNLDTTSRSQSVQGKAVSKNDLKRGDLMFFTNDSRKNKTGVERIGHVALYLGDNHILHTASDYAVIEEISAKRWSYYISARRAL